MNRSLFISLDGPKGTGKTTLLEALTGALRADKRKVVRLCERKSDPFRADTMALVNRQARQPSRTLELQVCECLARSRAWISEQVLPRQPVDSIVLIDRWYPSDAAFRRSVSFDEVLRLNIDARVRVPALHIGVVTAPDLSWARAIARPRGLASTVTFRLDEQIAATEAFERAAEAQGWLVCRNEGTLQQATEQLLAAITAVADQRLLTQLPLPAAN